MTLSSLPKHYQYLRGVSECVFFPSRLAAGDGYVRDDTPGRGGGMQRHAWKRGKRVRHILESSDFALVVELVIQSSLDAGVHD